MAIKPIQFSSDMVRAILEGYKTQTRFILKPAQGATIADLINTGRRVGIGFVAELPIDKLAPPQYAVGDLLWVRETWQALPEFDDLPPSKIPPSDYIIHLSDREHAPWDSRVRSSLFMPLWASRLTLEISDVRVERLQDISRDDVIAEGITGLEDVWAGWHQPFAALWESIYGNGAWDVNPWVAAYTFKPHFCNVEKMGES